MESLEINPEIYGQMIFHKDANPIQWGKVWKKLPGVKEGGMRSDCLMGTKFLIGMIIVNIFNGTKLYFLKW